MRKLTTKITALALVASFTTGLCPMAIAANNSGSGAQTSSTSAQADSAAGKSKSAAKTAEQNEKKSKQTAAKAKGARKAPADQSDAALGTGTVTDRGKGYRGIYLRAKAGRKGRILVKVPVGGKVEILADKDSEGWYQVRYTDGNDTVWSGYMAGAYVKTGVSSSPAATATVVKAEKVRYVVYIRADRSTDGKVLYKVPIGETISILSQADEDGWYQVSYTDGLGNTYNGYMRQEYVDTDNSDAADSLTGVVTTRHDFIYIRSEMDRSSKPVCKVPKGRTVSVLDRSAGEGWYQVRYKDSKGAHKGYMVSKYVVLDGVSSGTVQTSSAVLRSAADSASDMLEVIPQDTKVSILAAVGDWYQVSYDGQVGYVDSECFEKGAADAGNGYGTVIKDEVRLRSGRTAEAGILTTLKKGDTFRIIDVVDGWYETTFNGEQGYLKADSVSTTSSVSKGYIQVIATPSIMLRKGAGTDFDELGTVPTGTLLKVLDTMGSWYKVKYGKKVGYVIGDNDFVSATTKDGFQAYPDYAKIVSDDLSLREEPDDEAERITGIGEGMVVHVYDMENGWYRVTYGDDVGYIDAEYTQEDEGPATPIPDPEEEESVEEGSAGSTESGTSESTEPSEESSGGSGSSVLSYAEQYVGNPYQWGGSSLTNGCDCSGFVMSVYAHFGYSLPHSSAADRSVGHAVSESDMRPGDIVCYSGHVGIYAGNGQLLSALGEKYGITYNSVHYKKILAVRRMG